MRAVLRVDLEAELLLDQRDAQRIGAAIVTRQGEVVLLEDVVDGDGALVLLVRVAAADGGLVEGDGDQPVRSLLRSPSPLRQPQRFRRIATDRACPSSPLRTPERDRCRAERPQSVRIAFQDRGSLHEVKHAEARGETGRAGRGQDVVRTAHIIADGLRRVAAEEDRAGIADLGRELLRILRLDFEMLGRQPVDQGNGVLEPVDQDDRAVIAPARAGDLGLRQGPELALDRLLDRVGERGAVGDEDRLGSGIVLGLRQEIGGDPVRDCRAASARISTSEGPAIMSMPTWPKTRRLAAAT